MMSRVKRPPRTSVLVLAALLTLGGCSGVGMQEGLVVDGRAYSVEEVQEATQQFRELSGEPIQPQAVISVATAVPVLDEYFQGTTYEPSESTLRSELTGGGLDGEAAELTLDVARYQYYAAVLNDPASQSDPALGPVVERMADYPADVAAQDVQVNPRFGAWDPDAGQVAPQVPTWIQQSTDS